MLVVNPSKFTPQLIIWSTFNIFATWALVALLTVTLLATGLRANWILLNLEIIFILTSSTVSALVWTGNAWNLHPPFGLCLVNAAATLANTPLMAGAALSIVTEVWGTAMSIWHPRCRPVMKWIVWTPALLLFPYIFGIPLFIAAIVLGLKERSKVFRGSPFYCVLDRPSLQTTSVVLGAVFTFIALVLAAWTAVKMLLTRRRVGSTRLSDDSKRFYAFTFRVILFSLFVGAAFVAGIVALSSSFNAVIPDIIVASTGVGAFFIFASATVRCLSHYHKSRAYFSH
ncbi:hypothetical protein FB451DRAFT_1043979 [Mycena latifolia]|nr:hypothetical protein FB451DRAFT_1043979 [Mycena latifolia]